MGIKLIDIGEDFPHLPKWIPMKSENKDDKVGDIIYIFLKLSFMQQRPIMGWWIILLDPLISPSDDEVTSDK